MTTLNTLSPTSTAASDMLTAWLRSSSYKASFESQNLEKFKPHELIALAQSSSQPFGIPASWASPPLRYFSSQENFITVCSTSSGSAPTIKACTAAGLDPWICIQREHIDLEHKFTGHFQYRYYFALMSHKLMTSRILTSPTTEGSIALSKLAASFSHLHGAALTESFVMHMCDKVAEAAGTSLQGASGVMGARDRDAKRSAQILIACGAHLTALALTPETQTHLAASLAHARTYVETKSKPASFDPAKYKKALTAEKRERLISIMTLASRSNVDDAASAYLILGTPWLAEEPNALSVGIKSHPSVFTTDISLGSTQTLAAIESLGANIWIASAQQGDSNACHWAAQLTISFLRNSPFMASIARMLAYGAHLDEATDPVQYALDKLAEAQKLGAPQLICERLKSDIESIAFTQLLADSEEDAKDRAEEAARPRRQRL